MFDAHTHLHFEAFRNDLNAVIERAVDEGVRGVLLADYDSALRMDAVGLSRDYFGIWYTMGLHPWAVIDAVERGTLDREFTMLNDAVSSTPEGLCGIGECGLDGYYKGGAHHEVQVETFRKQLELGRNLGLPVVLHSVKRNEDILKILQDDGPPDAGGIVHGFYGSVQQARRFLEFGFDISIGLALTHGRRKLEEVVDSIDRERILVETDCPGRSPDGTVRDRSEPRDLREVIARIAEIWCVSAAEVAHVTATNTRRRFSLPDTLLSCRPTKEVPE